MIVGNGTYRMWAKSVFLSHPFKLASVISNQVAVFASHPKIPAVSFSHRDKAIGCDARRVALVEDGKSNAVEPCNSIQRGNPEVAVCSLDDAANAVLREASVSRPLSGSILCPSVGEGENAQDEECDGKCASRAASAFVGMPIVWPLRHAAHFLDTIQS
jgi:hypothetical protein